MKEKQKSQLHTSEFSTIAVDSCTVPRNVTKETPSKTVKKLGNEKKEAEVRKTAEPVSQPTTSPVLTMEPKKVIYQSTENEHNHKEGVECPPSAKKRCDSSSSDDAFERKRQHAMQYQKYLQREGPKNPGGKVVPQVLDYVVTEMCSVL